MTVINKEMLKKISDDVIHLRRQLHRYPELSGEEYETSKVIQSKLTEFGINFKTGYAKTGVLGIIKGSRPGGTVALRADIDALPIQERNQDSFRSQNDGIMHACGHDAHAAMLVGTGYLLNEIKEQLPGTVLLLFQPAEENSPVGGAKPMMEDGVFSHYPPDVIFGQHVWPDLPVGEIGIREGAIMGNSDKFKIKIKGSGGHASMPHQTIDAIIAANQVITALQTIVSRNVDPLDPIVLTIGKIEGGYRHNVIADQVVLEGTVRTFTNDARSQAKERLYSIVHHTVHAMGAEAEVGYFEGYPATINTPKWAQHIKQTAQRVLGEKGTPEVNPSLGGEDFSRFLEKIPGAFFWLGTQIEEKEKQMPLHDPRFQLNERALSIGVELMAQIAVDALFTLERGKKEENENRATTI